MSIATVCNSCGGRVEVADDYPRRKARCPACGVMCEMPAGPARPASAPQQTAAAPARDGRPASRPPGEKDEAIQETPRSRASSPRSGPARAAASNRAPVLGPPPAPAQSPSTWRDVASACSQCGGTLDPAEVLSGDLCGRCRTARAGRPAPAPTVQDDEDNGQAYEFVDKDRRICPKCKVDLAADAVLCVACGLDLTTKKKLRQEYQPFEKTWVAGWPYRWRFTAFLIAIGAVFALGLPAAIVNGILGPFAFFWLLFVGMLAFLLGTFDRVDFSRNRRGRVKLAKTWCVCFVRQPAVQIDVYEYEGVLTGRDNDTGFMDWLLCFMLLCFCIFPGVIWFFLMIHPDSFFVALAKDHGHAACMLYKGHNQEHVDDIARTIRQTAGLPFDQEHGKL